MEAEACPVVDGDGAVPGLPMVKVSWRDAHAYASWLSRETGERFRLPTDEEWAYAAAGRFQDDALPENLDAGNDSQRRLAIYDRDASRQETLDPTPRPVGNFGANENGLLDMAGNVWEWTKHAQRTRCPRWSGRHDGQLRDSRGRGPSPDIYVGFHSRCARGRLLDRHATEKSRFPRRTRRRPVGRGTPAVGVGAASRRPSYPAATQLNFPVSSELHPSAWGHDRKV